MYYYRFFENLKHAVNLKHYYCCHLVAAGQNVCLSLSVDFGSVCGLPTPHHLGLVPGQLASRNLF